MLAVSANAASPIVQIEYSDDQAVNTKGKTEVSDLQIICLEEPQSGKLFDTSAVVKTSEGVLWNIPVIWVDELG